ncbi:hypothetical protein LOTGIDRAFT_88868, partial [Lottia gigantea]
LNCPITQSEVIKCVQKMKSGTSPGPDGIVTDFYKACSDIFAPSLTKIFNTIFDYGSFPDSWLKAIISPLHK